MFVFVNQPTISTSAYGTGDVIGGANKIADVIGGLLATISVYDADGEGVQLDFFFFKAPLSDNYDDNDAFAMNAADVPNFIGVASVLTTDYVAAGSDSVATAEPVNIVLPNGAIHYVTVIRSTTTFTAITDLTFYFGTV